MGYILNVNTDVPLTSLSSRLEARPLDSMFRPLCRHFVVPFSGRLKYVNPHSCHAPTGDFCGPSVHHHQQQLTQASRRLSNYSEENMQRSLEGIRVQRCKRG